MLDEDRPPRTADDLKQQKVIWATWECARCGHVAEWRNENPWMVDHELLCEKCCSKQ